MTPLPFALLGEEAIISISIIQCFRMMHLFLLFAMIISVGGVVRGAGAADRSKLVRVLSSRL